MSEKEKITAEDIAHDFRYHEALETKRKELLGNLRSDAYAGYTEVYSGDTKKLLEKLQSYGIHVKKMGLLLDIRSKITGIKMVGLGIGPLIGIEKDSKDVESTITHEAIHVKQYKENTPVDFLKAWLGFIKFGIKEQGKIMKNLKNERKRYGTRTARRYSINNSPMEYEAYLHEGNINYLEKRKPFAYKQFETPKGRSIAVQELMNKDIDKRVKKTDELVNMVRTKKDISRENVAMINTFMDELLQDARKIQQIKKEYGQGDWELISTFKTPKGPMVRLEAEKNRDKRLEILDKLLVKEHAVVQELKKDKRIKLLSSQEEMDETGIIKITAKMMDNDDLLTILQNNPEIQKLAPEMKIAYSRYDKMGNLTRTYIRMSFVQ